MTESTEAATPQEQKTEIESLHDAVDDQLEALLGPDDEGDMHVAAPAKAKAEPDDAEDDEPAEIEEEDADGEVEESAEADSGEDEEGEEADEEAEEEEESDAGDRELDTAYATLLTKAHASHSDLKTLSRAKLIAWAARVDAASEAGADESEPAEVGRDVPEGAKASGEAAQPTTAKGRAAFRASVAEKLGVDEESVDALMPLYDANESLRGELKELRSSIEQQTAAANAREGRATIDAQVQRLSESYPAVATSAAKRQKLVDEASVLVAGLKARKADIDVRSVFDKAAMLAFGPPKRADLKQQRRNGVSPAPERRAGAASTSESSEAGWWGDVVDHALAGRADKIARMPPPPSLREEKPAKVRRW